MRFGTRSQKCVRLMLVVVLGYVAIARVAEAQLTTGTISGTVKDSSGAVIPGVAITATNVDTGLNRTGTSAADGSYKFPALPVGTYQIRAERPGFQAAVQEGLKLS